MDLKSIILHPCQRDEYIRMANDWSLRGQYGTVYARIENPARFGSYTAAFEQLLRHDKLRCIAVKDSESRQGWVKAFPCLGVSDQKLERMLRLAEQHNGEPVYFEAKFGVVGESWTELAVIDFSELNGGIVGRYMTVPNTKAHLFKMSDKRSMRYPTTGLWVPEQMNGKKHKAGLHDCSASNFCQI